MPTDNTTCNIRTKIKNRKVFSATNENITTSKECIMNEMDFQNLGRCDKIKKSYDINYLKRNYVQKKRHEPLVYPNVVEISNMESHNLDNCILNKTSDKKVRHIEISQEKRRSHSFMKNTPPATPSDCCHSDDWSTFDPAKVRTISETKANNILTDSLFLSSPEKKTSNINCSQHVENEEVFLESSNTFDSVKNENFCVDDISKMNKKVTFMKKFFSIFDFKRDTVKISNDNFSNLKSNKNCKNLVTLNTDGQSCTLKNITFSNQLNNDNIIYEKFGSISLELDVEKENYFHKISNRKCFDKISNSSSSNKFITQKLTSYQKKVVDNNCAPKFSPALRYLPNIPYGKMLAIYKGETLSTLSVAGTIVLHSTSKTMFDFKPLAHSTPFQTPKQSLGKIKNSNKNRGTILPYSEKGRIFENPIYSKEKISFYSNTSNVPSLTAPSYLTHIPEEMYVRKLNTLKHSIKKIKKILCTSEQIIHECSKKFNFNGSEIELSAKRIKLIGTNRIKSLKDEYEKTKILMNICGIIPRINSNILAMYTITDIKLELNRLFCFKKTQENISYVFCIILKSANNVVGTQIKTVEDVGSVRLKQIKFSDVIKFSKLPINFIISLEIYALKIGELDRTKLSRFKRSLKDLAISVFKPSYKKSSLISVNENTTTNPNDSLHPKNQISYDDFIQCGILKLNRDTIGNQKFYFEEAKFPLEGTICVNTECSPLPQHVEMAYSGFLSIYNGDDLKSYSIKMWTIVKRSLMKFWKSCDDEYDGQLPLFIMDMSKITSPQLERITTSEVGYKENSFYIDILCESKTSNCIYQHKRVYFSSECSTDCDNWLQYLNGILKTIRHEPDNAF
ncbi:Actin-binding protein anillin [Strongyloides ratti]|uniref:Actin-binding protein anillin n=1 Tax=Strongyloides ratti TaxID=34506 RepID=A0A090LQS1_STRRB|nr:Actin-binding protein anillin [Strongyloides ratti]CEF70526.1 Actin-binding protein anillin [Strongyloides ratti]